MLIKWKSPKEKYLQLIKNDNVKVCTKKRETIKGKKKKAPKISIIKFWISIKFTISNVQIDL